MKCKICGTETGPAFRLCPSCIKAQDSFYEWKILVNQIMFELIGLDSDALPDYDYYGAYKSGWSVKKTVKAAISNARNS